MSIRLAFFRLSPPRSAASPDFSPRSQTPVWERLLLRNSVPVGDVQSGNRVPRGRGIPKPEFGNEEKVYIDQRAAADARLVRLSYAVTRHESKDYNGEGSRYNQFWEGYAHRFNVDHRNGDPM